MIAPRRQPVDSPVDVGIAGPFTERLVRRVRENLDFQDFTLEVASLALGDNPFSESVSMEFRLLPKSSIPDARDEAGDTGMSVMMSFSFSSNMSVDENIADFRAFVESQASIAATPPVAID